MSILERNYSFLHNFGTFFHLTTPMTYKKAIVFAAAILAATASFGAKLEGKAPPRLVVNLVVGQMRYDYLLRFADNLSQEGFLAMVDQGASCDRAMYTYMMTSTPSGLATLTTGANPMTHGVIGTSWFDYTTNEKIELLEDRSYYTVGSDELDTRVSPVKLLTSTVGDQLKNSNPTSKVVSIALEPMSAVLMGGYNADVAYWVSERDGKWVSSTYYTSSLPEWVTRLNDAGPAESYTDPAWSVSLPTSRYHNILRQDIKTDTTVNRLSFDFMTRKKYDYSRLAATPAGNTYVKDFAVKAIINENLGNGERPDMLNVVFDASRNIGEKYGTQSMEVEDSYYRLDADIASLLYFLDSHLGRENVLVVLTSDHGACDPVIESSRMPSGKFNPSQFWAIMAGFLGGQLGSEEQWILDYSNRQLYLNHRLILEKGLRLSDVQNMVAGFAIQFRGVAQAITGTSMLNSHFSGGVLGSAQNGYFPRHSGDVIINLLPGWMEENGKLSASGTPYNYDSHVPLIWWGGRVPSSDIARDIDMMDLAPTISHLLGIAPPNASTGRPIEEIINY